MGSLQPAIIALTLSLLLVVSAASAQQQQQSREREALRRAQQQITKLQQDNAALQREKTEVESKLKAAEAELAKSTAQVGRLRKSEKSLAAVEKDRSAVQAKLGESEERLKEVTQKCQADLASLRRSLAQAEAAGVQSQHVSDEEHARLNGLLAAQTQRAQGCETMNQELYGVTLDLIARYKQNRGAWEKFLLSEPFTGLKSVEVENLLDDLGARAAEARVDTTSKPGPEQEPK